MNDKSIGTMRISMRAMQGLCDLEDELIELHCNVFRKRHLSASEADDMHKAICKELENDSEGLAVKAELFALLYICQPEALFRRRRLTHTVTDYAFRLMGMGRAVLSAHKQNLSFLYYKDKLFRTIAMRALSAAANVVENEIM